MMIDSHPSIPNIYQVLLEKSRNMGFTMASDVNVGSLLKTLVASKPSGNFLELGTGMGLTLSWMVNGMDNTSQLTTIDNNPESIKIAKQYFGHDKRVSIQCEDGADWIKKYKGDNFDLIFADAWPGKYSDLKETLNLLNVGGFYVIDDMLPQDNWPEGHAEKAKALVITLQSRKDLILTKIEWSTGVIITVKLNNN